MKTASGRVFVQPWPAGPSDKRKDHVPTTSTPTTGPGRTLRGIDEQVRKAEQVVPRIAVKRNQLVKLTGATTSVNRELEAKTPGAGRDQGYVTNLPDPHTQQVIGAYRRLIRSRRAAGWPVRPGRPIFHRTRNSIEAHLTIVFAALAVSRWIENTTGWSNKKFVKTVPRYRTITIQAGDHTIAADPISDDVHQVLEAIKPSRCALTWANSGQT